VCARQKLLDDIAGIADAIVRARAALRPAAAGRAAHPLPEEVFNRRWYLKPGKMPLNPFGELDRVKMNPGTTLDILDRPAGPTDPDITILSLQDVDRRPLALLASYSLHYVGHTPEGLMSADYFGEFARLMPFRLRAGKDFVAMMANGTSGDINNIPFLVNRPPREPFEQVRIVARKAADVAWFAFNTIDRHCTDVRLGMVERRITLERRKPTAEQIAWAQGVLAVTDEAERAKYVWKKHHFRDTAPGQPGPVTMDQGHDREQGRRLLQRHRAPPEVGRSVVEGATLLRTEAAGEGDIGMVRGAARMPRGSSPSPPA